MKATATTGTNREKRSIIEPPISITAQSTKHPLTVIQLDTKVNVMYLQST